MFIAFTSVFGFIVGYKWLRLWTYGSSNDRDGGRKDVWWAGVLLGLVALAVSPFGPFGVYLTGVTILVGTLLPLWLSDRAMQSTSVTRDLQSHRIGFTILAAVSLPATIDFFASLYDIPVLTRVLYSTAYVLLYCGLVIFLFMRHRRQTTRRTDGT